MLETLSVHWICDAMRYVVNSSMRLKNMREKGIIAYTEIQNRIHNFMLFEFVIGRMAQYIDWQLEHFVFRRTEMCWMHFITSFKWTGLIMTKFSYSIETEGDQNVYCSSKSILFTIYFAIVKALEMHIHARACTHAKRERNSPRQPILEWSTWIR